MVKKERTVKIEGSIKNPVKLIDEKAGKKPAKRAPRKSAKE